MRHRRALGGSHPVWLCSISLSSYLFLHSTLPDYIGDPGRQDDHLLSVIPHAPPQLSSPANYLSQAAQEKNTSTKTQAK